MAATPSTMLELGTKLPAFRLFDYNGKAHASDDYMNHPLLVMFICNHCPYVKHIREKLSELVKTYQQQGLSVIGINSNDYQSYPEDSPAQMKIEVSNFGYSFPYLVDESQDVAKAFRAACTPDFFLFDASHRLVYRGQFDDSRPNSEVPVNGDDLTMAVEHLLEGEQIVEHQKPSMGCNIKWKKGNEPNYYR